VPVGADEARQGVGGLADHDEVQRILDAVDALASGTTRHGFDRGAKLGLAHVADLVRSVELLNVHIAVFSLDVGDPDREAALCGLRDPWEPLLSVTEDTTTSLECRPSASILKTCCNVLHVRWTFAGFF
jgi:hypothetical protein